MREKPKPKLISFVFVFDSVALFCYLFTLDRNDYCWGRIYNRIDKEGKNRSPTETRMNHKNNKNHVKYNNIVRFGLVFGSSKRYPNMKIALDSTRHKAQGTRHTGTFSLLSWFFYYICCCCYCRHG